ncbi:hydroxymethylglutaryl-CoA lyase [Jiulongibacter sediminis]|jgi:hydroxymethylglutaryl-CoA lyase|uniref:hydroxymethylglutaryl-CoA lyase n=1 Tax=Jiulongibacter sediminis TaxID=1605367 RepID=UPI0026EDC1B4|nr:hydroxymethylglutaryl-CoA lyase [Jiulongibacter sediminis]
MHNIQITDCPRDAIQGLKKQIPPEAKAAYIQKAMDSGLFHSIDFGSFVSPKAVPQMADTEEVLKRLKKPKNDTQLLAIIANERGAERASQSDLVDILGFPFSISEEFQQRNTGAGREEALTRIARIQEIAKMAGQQVRIYLSMAFGNPYGEPWFAEEVLIWAEKLIEMGINSLALSDTIGVALQGTVKELFIKFDKNFPEIELSTHFHAAPGHWQGLIETAYNLGCRHFDGAFQGYGGCPMAKDELVGNIPTEGLLRWKGIDENRIEELNSAFQKLVSYA